MAVNLDINFIKLLFQKRKILDVGMSSRGSQLEKDDVILL